MKIYTAVYWSDLEKKFTPSSGLQLFIKGRTHWSNNCSFTKRDVKDWITDLNNKFDCHPILEELVILGTYLQNNKINLVLV